MPGSSISKQINTSPKHSVAHAAPRCGQPSNTTKQREPKRFVAHAASRDGEPQQSNTQGNPKRFVAHAASCDGVPTKQNQPIKPLSANVAHPAIAGAGSLDETVNKTRFEVSPEVDAVHSNSMSTNTGQVSINGELGVSSPLLTQLGRLPHFSNNEASSKEVSRSEVAVNKACNDNVEVQEID